jgi:tRNA (guanine37-N1)-methyltransferase
VVNIRDFAQDKHHVTDDRPYGGGAGMVLKVEPIYRALQAQPGYQQPAHKQHVSRQTKPEEHQSYTILLSARGPLFTQATAYAYTKIANVFLICGHYEGVDERVSRYLVDTEQRIGDYVLTGGEAAALVISDAITRLLPGTLGNNASLDGETDIQNNRGGYPQYTRPPVFNSWEVPTVLQAGNHKDISAWREENRSILETAPKSE